MSPSQSRRRTPENSPTVLIALLAFSLIVSLILVAAIVNDPLAAAIFPLSGGVSATPYVICLLIAAKFWWTDRVRVCRSFMLVMVAAVIWGGRALCSDHSNPYFHELRPLWIIVVPLLWLGALLLAYGLPSRSPEPRANAPSA
jgi:hypothetical protein